ncbi:uncharacterized protein LOC133288800 [Gastrolobium bilobum]|uniref:uncharacterized protein LOC133288800 n=1 Tax=Gastrolobium bilobum TaxID=150636 RepID=UPI002AB006AC|nr:uncharacterized protein LOC133288800 [Gastrolobium bilobum]
MTLLFSCVGGYMDNHNLVLDEASVNIADYPLVIGQEFPDVETCRRTLKDIAIAMHFGHSSRVIAKCSKERCPWRVHVAKCPGIPTFTIRTLHAEHTCEGVRNLHHQQASVTWVARSVEARIRDNPQYKPRDILQDIRDQHGVAVSYMQAWRGKERSMAALHGTFEEGYDLLPAYCEQIRKTNPGSIASVVATGHENCFQRLFISFRASIYGFVNACRPLLELDKAHLKGKYLGTLLCAAAIDADDALFPLAIAIVDTESDENWMWFMSEKCFSWFLSALFEFESKVAEMIEISQDVTSWFQDFPPQLWAVAYFEGVRYGHFSVGITQLLYNWALECHELPVVQMMEHIRHRITSWFNDRQDMGMRWTSILVPSVEKRMLDAISDAHCYQVLRANEIEFEIVSTERTNIVDIRSRVCSCHRWQLYGLPCAHAAAALISCGHNAHMFAEPCFTVESYRVTYSQMINPILDKSYWREQGEGAEGGGAKVALIICPPKIRRPPGRPKKKVLQVENFMRPKRVVQCGRCHLLGHSQKKCTMPL